MTVTAPRGAVIAGLAADHFPALGLAFDHRMLPGELDRCLGRLGAAGDEEGALETGAGETGHELSEPDIGLVLEHGAAGEGNLFCLLDHGLQHALVAVADVADDGAGRGVDIAPAVGVPHIDALGPRHRGPLFGALLLIEGLDRPAGDAARMSRGIRHGPVLPPQI